MTKASFINESKPRSPTPEFDSPGTYGYDRPSKYLFTWSTLLQAVVSQAGSYLLSGKFHANDCGIYKSEGGCRIEGAGDLVLGNRGLYFDYDLDRNKPTKTLAKLVTAIVLQWDPMDPIDSMLSVAATEAGCTPKELKTAVEKSTVGGVFGGNCLSRFFDWNPFGKPPIDLAYERWCRVEIKKESAKDVDQNFADRKLGEELLQKLQTKSQAANGHSCLPMCCSPWRNGDKLTFWINTGSSTQIDGSKTLAEIKAYLKGDGRLTAKY